MTLRSMALLAGIKLPGRKTKGVMSFAGLVNINRISGHGNPISTPE